MNIIDIVIFGSVVLLTVVGMMSGVLKPTSGIGGLILGGILAVNYQAQAATLLVPYVDSDIMRRIAAFVGIVLTAAVATRVFAGLFKKLLSALVLGWADHVAVAVAGAALGTVLVGTIIYVMTGGDLRPTRTALAASQFASDISRGSLVVADTLWCPEGVESTDGEACTDLKGLFSQVLGRHMPVQVDEIMDRTWGHWSMSSRVR